MTTSSPPSPRAPRSEPVSPASAAAELLRRRAARRSLLDFTLRTKPDYRPSWHHALLCRAIDRWISGEGRPNLIVCVPPQHGKSELVSRRLPGYLLGRDADARVIACSYGASLACAMNLDAQRVIDCGRYRSIFPGTTLGDGKGGARRNSDLFEVAGRAGAYRSAGVGGPIVGLPMDWGIIDDPFKNREEADSPAVREAVWRWYTGAFLSRAHSLTRKLICHTRWHPDDLVGRLLKQAEDDPAADQWDVVVLPAVAEGTLHPEDPRRPGEALWPERFPLPLLMQRRAASLTDWAGIYQQRPRAVGSVEWPDELFDWPGFWFDDWPGNCALKVMSLDPSKGSDSKQGDYQAAIKWGRTPDGTEWVEADLAKRPVCAARTADDVAIGEGMCERVVELYKAFGPECLALETNTFQQLLTIPLHAEAKRQRIELRIVELDNRVNKNVRIRRLGGPLSARRMRFRRTPGTRLLVEQLKQFPTADHDDGPDGLEMARRTAIELWNGRQQKQGRMRA